VHNIFAKLAVRWAIERVMWRHSNLWSQCYRHDVVLYAVNWWRYVTLLLSRMRAQ